MHDRTRRCWGVTKDIRLCRRSTAHGLFCTQHRRQPLYFAIVALTAIIFSYVAGLIPNPFRSKNSAYDQGTHGLRVVATTFTHDGAFDTKLLNTSDMACFITRIDVTCLEVHGAWIKMPVQPSAKYVIPVEGIKTGETRSLAVSFTVPPKSPERILLYVNSSRMYTLRVALRYNADQVASFTNRTWDLHAFSSGSKEPRGSMHPVPSQYVLWDGQKESPYAETGRIHDCVYLYDGRLSCQDVRREFLRLGFVHTMFFGCGSGEVAFTSTNGGLFTQSLDAVLKQDPQVTIRDAVCLVNQSMHSQGFDQNCEVVARRDVLDLPLLTSTVKDAPHVLCMYDICRTPIPESGAKTGKWHRIKPRDFGPVLYKN